MELLGVSELADVGDGGDEGDATAAMASASRGRDRQSVSASDGDRNVRRKNCALDFDTLDCPICLESLAAPVYQVSSFLSQFSNFFKVYDRFADSTSTFPYKLLLESVFR